jgi:hypothetical protein
VKDRAVEPDDVFDVGLDFRDVVVLDDSPGALFRYGTARSMGEG